MEYTVGSKKNNSTMATAEPIKLDLNRSIDNLLVSFSSGEMTRIIESNVQKSSKSENSIYNL